MVKIGCLNERRGNQRPYSPPHRYSRPASECRYGLLVDRTCVFDPLLDFLLAYLHRESAVRQQYIHNVVELPTTGYCTSAVVQKIQKKRVQLEGFASATSLSAKVTQPKQSRGSQLDYR